MVLKIKSNQQVIWRTPQSLQVGVGGQKVVLDQVTAGQERMVAALLQGFANNQLETFAGQSQLELAEAGALLEKLRPVLQPTEIAAPHPKVMGRPKIAHRVVELDAAGVASAFAEIIRASLVNGIDGEQVLLERSRRVIHIDELNRTGLALAMGLAAAGLGAVISHDQNQVLAQDVGGAGFHREQLGQSRLTATDWLVRSSSNRMQVVAGQKISKSKIGNVDAAVLVGHQVIEPRLYARWMNRQVPHIAIVFDTEGVLVTPLIRTGEDPCLFCLELHRTDEDFAWPAIASQLLVSDRRLDDSASVMFAAGLVLRRLLIAMDGQNGEQSEAIYFDAATGEISARGWGFHPDCACRSGGLGFE